MKENISVSVRLRPLNEKEVRRNEKEVVSFFKNKVIIDNKTVLGYQKTLSPFKEQDFFFSNCFGPQTTTEEIHKNLTRNIVLQSIRGINSTIFVYGQTGSGKTFTITGDVDFQQNVFHSQQRRLKSKSPLKTLNKSLSKNRQDKSPSNNSKNKTPLK